MEIYLVLSASNILIASYSNIRKVMVTFKIITFDMSSQEQCINKKEKFSYEFITDSRSNINSLSVRIEN